MRYRNMTRSLAMMLVCILVFQMTVPAMATEEAIEDQIGTIEIYSEWTQQVEWDALLHKENGSDYEILLKAEDIAELTGTTLSYRFDELVFARGTYEVRVDPLIRSVLVYLNPPDGKERVLYGGEFELPYCVVAEDAKNINQTYLPLEKLFYLLNVTWFCYDSAVFISSPEETLWNVIGDYLLMAKATPKQAEVVSITVEGKVSDEVKYGLIAFAEEADRMFDYTIIWSAIQTMKPEWGVQLALLLQNEYKMETYESALAELSYPAAVRLAEVESAEVEAVRSEIEDRFELLNAPHETVNNILDMFGLADDLYVGMNEGEELFTTLVTLATKTDSVWGMEDIGFTALDFAGYGMSMLEITANAHRSKYWTDGYVGQLECLANMDVKTGNPDIQQAAERLLLEYNYPEAKMVWELNKESIIGMGKSVVQSSPYGLYLSAYDGIRGFVKLVDPVVNDLMSVGSLHESACVQYDVSKLTVAYYTQTLETLLRDGLSQDAVEQIHLLGSLMTNASAHCYFNLYDIAKALEASGEEDAHSAETMLRRYGENCELALRLEQASRYDPRLFIFKPYYNLYSEEEGSVRQQIPESYVKIGDNVDVIVTVEIKEESVAGYSGSIVQPTVYVPGNDELASQINQVVGETLLAKVRNVEGYVKDMLKDYSGTNNFYCNSWLDSAYAADNALSLGIGYSWYADTTRPIYMYNSVVLDLKTGTQLNLTELLDPNEPTAKEQLRNLIRKALEDVLTQWNAQNNMLADMAADKFIADEQNGNWCFNAEGLVLSMWYQNQRGEALIPYGAMEGIIDSAFIPGDHSGDGSCMIKSASDAQMAYGVPTGKVLVVEGVAVDVTVLSKDTSAILFYASRISNAMAWVPEAEQYTIHNR